jgi:hypothetical protein
MAIDISSEQLISLRDAAGLLPARRRGKKPHVSCVYRWTTTGCRGVLLDSVSVGGTRCTSREALVRFIELLSAPAGTGASEKPLADRECPNEVERALDDAGIG